MQGLQTLDAVPVQKENTVSKSGLQLPSSPMHASVDKPDISAIGGGEDRNLKGFNCKSGDNTPKLVSMVGRGREEQVLTPGEPREEDTERLQARDEQDARPWSQIRHLMRMLQAERETNRNLKRKLQTKGEQYLKTKRRNLEMFKRNKALTKELKAYEKKNSGDVDREEDVNVEDMEAKSEMAELEEDFERIRVERRENDQKLLYCDNTDELEYLQRKQDALDKEDDILQERLELVDTSDEGMDEMEDNNCITSDEKDFNYFNNEICQICRQPGLLVLCDRCPAAFHPECIGLTEETIPEGNLYCTDVKRTCLGTTISKHFEEVVKRMSLNLEVKNDDFENITAEIEKMDKFKEPEKKAEKASQVFSLQFPSIKRTKQTSRPISTSPLESHFPSREMNKTNAKPSRRITPEYVPTTDTATSSESAVRSRKRIIPEQAPETKDSTSSSGSLAVGFPESLEGKHILVRTIHTGGDNDDESFSALVDCIRSTSKSKFEWTVSLSDDDTWPMTFTMCRTSEANYILRDEFGNVSTFEIDHQHRKKPPEPKCSVSPQRTEAERKEPPRNTELQPLPCNHWDCDHFPDDSLISECPPFSRKLYSIPKQFLLWNDTFYPETPGRRKVRVSAFGVTPKRREKRRAQQSYSARTVRSRKRPRSPIDVIDLTVVGVQSDPNSEEENMMSSILSQTGGTPIRQKPVEQEPLSTMKRRRRNIKKIQDKITEAEKEEIERLKRLEMRKKILMSSEDNELLVINHNSGDEKKLFVPRTISINLKQHQKEGIQFMWDNVFESLEKFNEGTAGNGCILSHLMGLGKTLQALAFLQGCLQNDLSKHVLIVAPVNVLNNWLDEFRIWLDDQDCPQLFHIHKLGSRMLENKSELRLSTLEKWRDSKGVMIIGFEAFVNCCQPRKSKKNGIAAASCSKTEDITARSRKILLELPDLVIIDEGHRIRNKDSTLSSVLGGIKTKRRIVLTGTPLQNNLNEYYQMISFVRPGLLGSEKQFRNQFVNPIENGRCADSTQTDINKMKRRIYVLIKKTSGFIHRRGFKAIVGQMPSLYEYTLFLRLNDLQKRLYIRYNNLPKVSKRLFDNFANLKAIWDHPFQLTLRKQLNDKKCQKNSKQSTIQISPQVPAAVRHSISGLLTRVFSQLESKEHERGRSIHDVAKEAWEAEVIGDDKLTQVKSEDSPKVQICLQLIDQITSNNEKVICFASSVKFLKILESILQDEHGFVKDKNYFYLSGTTKAEHRGQMVAKFNSEENKTMVFLISTMAGGIGINLIGANHAILCDIPWNPSHNQQAIHRIFRFRQKKPCHIYRLVAAGTMEERVYERCITKMGMALRVVDKRHIRNQFTAKNLVNLYRTNLDYDREENSDSTGSEDEQFNDENNNLACGDIDELPEGSIVRSLIETYGLKSERKIIHKFHVPQTLLRHVESDALTEEEKNHADQEDSQYLATQRGPQHREVKQTPQNWKPSSVLTSTQHLSHTSAEPVPSTHLLTQPGDQAYISAESLQVSRVNHARLEPTL